MANKLKGEIDLISGDQTYVLCFPTNAIVQVEELFGGKGIGEIMQAVAARPSMADVRTLLWGSLQTHHKGIDLIGIGPIIDNFDGPLEMLVERIARAIRFRLSRTDVDAPLEG